MTKHTAFELHVSYFYQGESHRVRSAIEPVWDLVATAHRQRQDPLPLSQIMEIAQRAQWEDRDNGGDCCAQISISSHPLCQKLNLYYINIYLGGAKNTIVSECYKFYPTQIL